MELFDYEKKHAQMLRAHLAECTVLLKSDGSFPLEKPCRIAAYGGGVRHTVKGGTGSGEVNSRYVINVEQGLTDAGFEITTKAWLRDYEEKYAEARKSYVKAVKAEAKEKKINPAIYGMGRVMPEPDYDLPLDGDGEAALYVLSRICGEGNDRAPVRGDVKLSLTEKRDILALSRKFEKFMLVLNVGGPVDLSEVAEVGNILVLSQLGADTGAVLADILLGKANPSGRLTTTWTAWEDYSTIGTFGDYNDTRYREGIYVGYRYFDSIGRKALFPFGCGLSYTNFHIDVNDIRLDGSAATVEATVTNTGKRPGKEVLQVYVSVPSGRLDQPFQSLAGFAKTEELAPGEAGQVTVSFDLRDLSSYDESRAACVLEQGDYIVRVGSSSAETAAAAVISLDAEAVVKQVRAALGKPDFTDWRPETRAAGDIPAGVPTLKLSAATITPATFDYDKAEEIDSAVRRLTNEQLVYANIGAFNPKGGVLSIIGSASTGVAGAAGETTAMLRDAGFPSAIMADGGSGLRLSKAYYRDEKGAHAVGSYGIPETVIEYMPAPLQWLTKLLNGKSKAPKGARVEYQYCTAIPIGTALAQSWNTDFARLCGDIVGDEMERFGVHFWLAPSINIHRSILCGRNFEYYSEDPLVSGLMSAAVVQGVQQHPGRAAVIKHFAANNQETNRYSSNSMVSERALREIYLRSFEICIREAQPHAVMSSYNLLNGQHTAERRDLCQGVLRTEFGFHGILMTDWVVGGSAMNSKDSIHAPVRPRLVAAAGGDLMMPGDVSSFRDMLEGLREGSLTKEQLQMNATRVYRMVNMLTGHFTD